MSLRHVLAAILLAGALPGSAQDLNLVTGVTVQDQGKTVLLTVTGSKPPNFTTFSMADPPRFVLDLSEAKFQGVAEDMPVNDGTVLVVKNLSYGSDQTSIARIMIAFAADVEPPDVQSQGSTLVVTIVKPASAASAQAPLVAAESAAARAAADAKARAEADAAARADAQARAEAEAQARAAEEKAAAERKAQQEAQAKAQAEAAQAAQASAAAPTGGAAAVGVAAGAAAAGGSQAESDARVKAEVEAELATLEKERQEAAAQTAAQAAGAAQQRAAEEAQAKADLERQRQEAIAAAKLEADRKKQAQLDAKAEAKRQKEEAAAAKKAEADRKKQEALAAKAEAKRQKEEVAAAKKAEAELKKQEALAAKAEAKRQRQEAIAAAKAAADQKALDKMMRKAGAGEVTGPAAQVRELGFKQLPGASRVFVRTSAPPRFTIQDAGENVIRVEVENARAARRNDMRFLDTSFFPSAVAMITPSRKGSTYVVEIRLKQKVPYQQKVEGDMLAIDFERPGAAAGAPAAGLPAEPASDAPAEEAAPGAEPEAPVPGR